MRQTVTAVLASMAICTPFGCSNESETPEKYIGHWFCPGRTLEFRADGVGRSLEPSGTYIFTWKGYTSHVDSRVYMLNNSPSDLSPRFETSFSQDGKWMTFGGYTYMRVTAP